MSRAQKRVLEMVEGKKISSEEGEVLLRAMEKKRRSGIGVVVNPFPLLGSGVGLAVGAFAAVLSVVAAHFLGIRWDGFLDLHMGGKEVGLATAAADQIVAWPLSALVLWLVALIFDRGVRLVDFLSTLGLVRVIQLIGGVLTVLVSPSPELLERIGAMASSDPMEVLGMLPKMIPMLIVGIVMFGWFVTALVFAVRHATAAKRGKLVGTILLGIFLAEAISKLALFGFSFLA